MLLGLPAADFPKSPALAKDTTAVPRETLLALLTATIAAVAADESRYHLTGIMLGTSEERGTVAVFGRLEALKRHVPQIATEYSRRVGAMPDIFEGTSPGAMQFGTRRYQFGASGWQRFTV